MVTDPPLSLSQAHCLQLYHDSSATEVNADSASVERDWRKNLFPNNSQRTDDPRCLPSLAETSHWIQVRMNHCNTGSHAENAGVRRTAKRRMYFSSYYSGAQIHFCPFLLPALC